VPIDKTPIADKILMRATIALMLDYHLQKLYLHGTFWFSDISFNQMLDKQQSKQQHNYTHQSAINSIAGVS